MLIRVSLIVLFLDSAKYLGRSAVTYIYGRALNNECDQKYESTIFLLSGVHH